MHFVVVDPPATEPLTLAEARAYARIDSTNEDADDPVLAILIGNARQAAEQELNRYLITQTVELYLDHFPRGRPDDDACPWYERHAINLPPVQSVTSVTYTALDGTAQTLDPSLYIVDAPPGRPARVTPAYGIFWPPELAVPSCVKVRFVAGYGTDGAAVPLCIKYWIALAVKTTWDNRDGLIVGERGQVLMPPTNVDRHLDPERLARVSN